MSQSQKIPLQDTRNKMQRIEFSFLSSVRIHAGMVPIKINYMDFSEKYKLFCMCDCSVCLLSDCQFLSICLTVQSVCTQLPLHPAALLWLTTSKSVLVLRNYGCRTMAMGQKLRSESDQGVFGPEPVAWVPGSSLRLVVTTPPCFYRGTGFPSFTISRLKVIFGGMKKQKKRMFDSFDPLINLQSFGIHFWSLKKLVKVALF